MRNTPTKMTYKDNKNEKHPFLEKAILENDNEKFVHIQCYGMPLIQLFE